MMLREYIANKNIDVNSAIDKLNDYCKVSIWKPNSKLSEIQIKAFDSINWSANNIKINKIPDGIKGTKLALLKIPYISKNPLNIYSVYKYFNDLNIYYQIDISFAKCITNTVDSAIRCALSNVEGFKLTNDIKNLSNKASRDCYKFVLCRVAQENIDLSSPFDYDIMDIICEFFDEDNFPDSLRSIHANYQEFVKYFYPGFPLEKEVYSLPLSNCFKNMVIAKGRSKLANDLIRLFYGMDPKELTIDNITDTIKILREDKKNEVSMFESYSIESFYSLVMIAIEIKKSNTGRLNKFYDKEKLKLYQPGKANSVWAIYTPMGKK